MKELATIIFCLNNREYFTDRYLKLAQQLSYNYEFLIIKEKRARFPIIPKGIQTRIIEIDKNIEGMAGIFSSIENLFEHLKDYKYCHFVEDDNFVFPKTIKSILSEGGKSEDALTGKAYIYNRDGERNLNKYYLASVKGKSANERIKEYNSRGGLTYYSIFPVNLFIDIINSVKKCKDDNLCEVLFNYLAVIKTRIIYHNDDFLCREYPRPKIYNIPSAFEWITKKELGTEIERAVIILEENMILLEKFDKEELFRNTIGHYLSLRFKNQKSLNFNKIIKILLKRKSQNIEYYLSLIDSYGNLIKNRI